MNKNTKVELLIIDPQNDFADPSGTLFVPGGDKDMKDRLPKFLKRIQGKLTGITCTLDQHHPVHIAHGVFWKDSNGNHPNPFTLITVKDVETGKWTPARPGLYKRALEYVRSLEKNGKYVLCIWPVHCRIGSTGAAVVSELREELNNWENNFNMVSYTPKGSNPYTENYSCVVADCPDPTDPTTHLNIELISRLENMDTVLIAGLASSHCVCNTVRDICNNFSDSKYTKKIVLLRDAMSAVPGFEKLAEDFYSEMESRGVQMSSTVDFLK